MNRRNALKTLARTAAGVCVLGGLPTSGAQAVFGQSGSARRQVVIGGRRVRVVDMHAHCMIPLTDVVAGTPFEANGAAIGGNRLGAERLQVMDAQGVDVQVLSINNYWWYAAERELAEAIVRAQNDGLGAWVASHPDRFTALASVSLQFPDLAAQQLEDAFTRLKMPGVSIGGHVNGEDLSLPKFDQFWAKAEALGAIVLMHPGGAENIVKPGVLAAGRGDLVNVIGNPLETTYFLSRLIFDGTFDRFPELTVFASHAGGYLPSYLGRTDAACVVRPTANCANTRKPSEYLRSQVLVDTMVFSEEGLRHLIAEVGVSQVVYGTDVPYTWPVTVDLVLNASFLADADKTAILGGNLEGRLGLK